MKELLFWQGKNIKKKKRKEQKRGMRTTTSHPHTLELRSLVKNSKTAMRRTIIKK